MFDTLKKTRLLYESLDVQIGNQVHPRVMLDIVDGVIKQENDDLLEWWAGITIAACEKCPTDEDLVFLDKMDRITCLQAAILKHLCENSKIYHTSRGLLLAKDQNLTDMEIFQITGVQDVDKLDREIDSLRNYGLVDGGFDLHKNDLVATISPTSLGLQFYARCKGIKSNLAEFYSSEEITECPRCGRIHK